MRRYPDRKPKTGALKEKRIDYRKAVPAAYSNRKRCPVNGSGIFAPGYVLIAWLKSENHPTQKKNWWAFGITGKNV